jgi:hypothetical protein
MHMEKQRKWQKRNQKGQDPGKKWKAKEATP